MEKFSVLLALYEFRSQGPVTRGVDVFFDLCLNKRLSKQSKRRSFKIPPHPLWRHCNANSEQCRDTYVNNMATDVLHSQVASLSTTMGLNMQDKQILPFHKDGFDYMDRISVVKL